MADLVLLACQIAVPPMTTAPERDAHLAATAAKVEAALTRAPADLVVLPELASIDYARAAFERLPELAEPRDGASWRCWSAVARRHTCHVAYGFARTHEAGGFRISIGVVGPDGALVGVYDKLHLAQYGASMEKEYFDRGDRLCVFEVRGLRIAPIICYDIRIPELARALVLDHGVDMILHCGAYFRDESFATWHPFATTRALENQVFLLSLNRAGRDWGASGLFLPWMDETRGPVLFDPEAEDLRHLSVARRALEDARRSYTFLKDRHASYAMPLSDAQTPE